MTSVSHRGRSVAVVAVTASAGSAPHVQSRKLSACLGWRVREVRAGVIAGSRNGIVGSRNGTEPFRRRTMPFRDRIEIFRDRTETFRPS
ncbi:hypothetical protein FHS42_001214 [Streptomyces zagrosensis]|uniref:Uncharacterized protein n=1 Tax=Streptomyces zagrosensis TaxID=1042984 RepID=A0A7W9UWV2_9ACTN|nr:hypothetical protein [Streptomyces zagrosensis]